MSGAVAAAVVGSAIIGTASAQYSASQTRKAQRDAANERQRLKEQEEARLAQVAQDTAPEQEVATVEFGNPSATDGSYNDFLVPTTGTKTSKLGGTGSSGLGTSVGSALGFK